MRDDSRRLFASWQGGVAVSGGGGSRPGSGTATTKKYGTGSHFIPLKFGTSFIAARNSGAEAASEPPSQYGQNGRSVAPATVLKYSMAPTRSGLTTSSFNQAYAPGTVDEMTSAPHCAGPNPHHTNRQSSQSRWNQGMRSTVHPQGKTFGVYRRGTLKVEVAKGWLQAGRTSLAWRASSTASSTGQAPTMTITGMRPALALQLSAVINFLSAIVIAIPDPVDPQR